MIKRFIFLLVIAFSVFTFWFILIINATKENFISKIENYQKGTYLVLLGNKNKLSDKIKNGFNYLKNSKYNHVGFLIISSSGLHIIDVHPDAIRKFPFLIKKDFRNLILNHNNQIEYISIWKIKNLKSETLLGKLNFKDTIHYDYNFDNKTSNKLYCSEFVAKTLENIFHEDSKFILLTKKLNKLEEMILRKDSIQYYPVDFFIKNSHFVFVSEWSKN